MSAATPSPTGWDLSPVIELFHSLSIAIDESYEVSGKSSTSSTEASVSSFVPRPDICKNHTSQLGNFDNVWKFLGVPLDSPAPTVSPSTDQLVVTNEKLHIDGSGSLAPKGVTWQDGLDGAGIGKKNHQNAEVPHTPPKKLSKKQKRHLDKQLKLPLTQTQRLDTTSDDEDSPQLPVSQLRKSSDRQQIIQQILHGKCKSPKVSKPPKTPKSPKATRDAGSVAIQTPSAGAIKYQLRNRDVREQNSSPPENVLAFKQASVPKAAPSSRLYMNDALTKNHPSNQPNADPTPITSAYRTPPKPVTESNTPLFANLMENRPIGSSDYGFAMLQASDRPTEGSTFAIAMYDKVMELYNDPAAALHTYRQALLVDKLKAQFPSERRYLEPLHTSPTLVPNGIHVFVDASNVSPRIFISTLRSLYPLPMRTPSVCHNKYVLRNHSV